MLLWCKRRETRNILLNLKNFQSLNFCDVEFMLNNHLKLDKKEVSDIDYQSDGIIDG